MGAYLDNSATTRVCAAAVDKAVSLMTADFGNPSSLHSMGLAAEQAVTAARRQTAALFGIPQDAASLSSVVFTSGGTEANNLALFGAAAARGRRGKHIVTTAIEHPSVLEVMRTLEKDGFSLTLVQPNADGDLSADDLVNACREDTVLVAAMLVNNEIGTLLPLREAIPRIRRRSPLAHIHCDAVQAAGKLPLKAVALDVDSMSVSGHKLHAPKGVGALYVKRSVRLVPRVYGGGQERALRSGTEAVPLIGAFGAAIEALPPSAVQLEHFTTLSDRLVEGLRAMDNTVLHRPSHRVPYIVNVSVRGFKSETLVHFLASRDVFVSSGSACARGQQSHVLQALGLPREESDSALRISLCADNTPEEIDLFLAALREATQSLAGVG